MYLAVIGIVRERYFIGNIFKLAHTFGPAKSNAMTGIDWLINGGRNISNWFAF